MDDSALATARLLAAAADAADNAAVSAHAAAESAARAEFAASGFEDAAGNVARSIDGFTLRVERTQMGVAEVQEALVAVGREVEKKLAEVGNEVVGGIRDVRAVEQAVAQMTANADRIVAGAMGRLVKAINAAKIQLPASTADYAAEQILAKLDGMAPRKGNAAPSADAIAAAVAARMPSARRGMAPAVVGAFFGGGAAAVLAASALRVDVLTLPMVGAGFLAAGVVAVAVAWKLRGADVVGAVWSVDRD